MLSEHRHPSSLRKCLVLMLLALAGLAAIVGSGGGVAFLPSDCPPGYDCNAPVTPVPIVQPSFVTAQVGSPVSFSAAAPNVAAGGLTFQWYRSSDGGAHFVAMPGATSGTLSLPAVNLADDGAVFRVAAQSGGFVGYEVGHLAVAAGPGVVYADGEFSASDWLALITGVPIAIDSSILFWVPRAMVSGATVSAELCT